MRYSVLAVLVACTVAAAEDGKKTIDDPFIRLVDSLCEANEPPAPPPDSYGMDPATGRFIHPAATPHQHDTVTFAGELDYWDSNEYAKNMKVEAYYPWVVEPFHTWQNIVDFDGRRYLYQYVRRDLGIFDITDPKNVKKVYEKGSPWDSGSPGDEVNPYAPDDMFGAASIMWNAELGKMIMVQSFEIQRFGVINDKRAEPDKVAMHRSASHLKGFKVYEMNGPLPEDWNLLSETTTDVMHPNAPVGEQEGSGVRDIPMYFGGKYMFVGAAPDATFALTEYPTDLYSSGYQAWDMSDPSNPVFLDQFAAPGQRIGDHDAYVSNPRCGNRTSWFGARMPLFVPRPVEDGGRYGYAAMAGLGLYVLDISDPGNMKAVGHLEFPPNVAGTEGDNIDVSQVEKTGIIYYSGYPLAESCYEPYKDIYAIDVSDPTDPRIVATLPRPVPPADAPFTDFCQRRGSFGPKRTGYYNQPGTPRDGILPYAFYNAGVQVFDVNDPESAEIVAYFVPKFDEKVASYARGNLAHGIYVEYDRNIIWLFTNHGFYALSTPVLGEPDLDAPDTVWPPRS